MSIDVRTIITVHVTVFTFFSEYILQGVNRYDVICLNSIRYCDPLDVFIRLFIIFHVSFMILLFISKCSVLACFFMNSSSTRAHPFTRPFYGHHVSGRHSLLAGFTHCALT